MPKRVAPTASPPTPAGMGPRSGRWPGRGCTAHVGMVSHVARGQRRRRPVGARTGVAKDSGRTTRARSAQRQPSSPSYDPPILLLSRNRNGEVRQRPEPLHGQGRTLAPIRPTVTAFNRPQTPPGGAAATCWRYPSCRRGGRGGPRRRQRWCRPVAPRGPAGAHPHRPRPQRRPALRVAVAPAARRRGMQLHVCLAAKSGPSSPGTPVKRDGESRRPALEARAGVWSRRLLPPAGDPHETVSVRHRPLRRRRNWMPSVESERAYRPR